MLWDGFASEDFAVFEAEGFAARMPLLRQRIKPKLLALSAEMLAPLSGVAGEPLYPHVAQHLRRTVNAPEETWAAFARARRAYKPFVHLRIAIQREGLRVLVFVEDYANEKEAFAAGLASQSEEIAALFARHPEILAYDMRDSEGNPQSGAALNASALREFGARMQRIKGQHAVFGVPMLKERVLATPPDALLQHFVQTALLLKPLYALARSDGGLAGREEA